MIRYNLRTGATLMQSISRNTSSPPPKPTSPSIAQTLLKNAVVFAPDTLKSTVALPCEWGFVPVGVKTRYNGTMPSKTSSAVLFRRVPVFHPGSMSPPWTPPTLLPAERRKSFRCRYRPLDAGTAARARVDQKTYLHGSLQFAPSETTCRF